MYELLFVSALHNLTSEKPTIACRLLLATVMPSGPLAFKKAHLKAHLLGENERRYCTLRYSCIRGML